MTRLSPAFTPPPGRSQYSPRPLFSCRHKQDAVLPPQHGRYADARLHYAARRPEAADAALALRELLHLDWVSGGHRHDDELRDAHPRLDDERLSGVGVQEDDAQLAP